MVFVDSYITFGLNRYRRFLDSETIYADDIEEYCVNTLISSPCECCAMFVVLLDGSYMAVFKFYIDEEKFVICRLIDEDEKLFAQLDGDIRLCCYSLLFEVSKGEYEIR